MTVDDQRMWTVSELGEYLGLEVVSVEGFIARGELNATVDLGGQRVMDSELERFIADRRITRWSRESR